MGYEICTYSLPFRNIVPSLGILPASRAAPPELADLIARMLTRDPKDRPTAREVLEEAMRHQ